MSFILEQLKKSGKKRKLEMAIKGNAAGAELKDAPRLRQNSPDSRPAGPGGSRLPWVVLCIVLTAAAFSAGFMYLRRDTAGLKAAAPAVVAEVKPQTAVATNPAPEPGPAQKDVQAMQLPKAEAARPDTAAAVRKPPLREKAVIAHNEPVEKPVSEIKITEKEADKREAPAVSSRSARSQPEQTGGIMDIKQLPPSVRKALPDIKITSHLYKKDTPLVSINGRIMSAGINLDNGLYLEEITPDGVIMVFRNHRFSVTAD